MGGTVPDAVLAGIDAGLAGLAGADERPDRSGGLDGVLDRLRARPAVAATAGGIVVLILLLLGMTVLGLVL